MFIKELKLHNFRNLQGEAVRFSPAVNFIYGNNAQGKTNLIEAVSLLSFARSLRSQSIAELPRWGQKSCSVFATIARSDSEFEAGVVIDNGSKTAYINGDRVSAVSDFVGKLLCVSFTPDDLQLVKGAPAERRRFLDRHISEAWPRFLHTLVSYSRALKNKSRLLSERRVNVSTIRPWNAILAKNSHEILHKRRQFITDIQERINSIHSRFAPADGELKLLLKTNLEEAGCEPDIGSLEGLFEASAQREIDGRACFLGVHRDDLQIFIDCRDARLFASQGQARSITLSLKMAVVELLEKISGESPVVLLDDLESELDNPRKEQLFDMILSHGRQVLITGTQASCGSEKLSAGHMQLEVAQGRITQR